MRIHLQGLTVGEMQTYPRETLKFFIMPMMFKRYLFLEKRKGFIYTKLYREMLWIFLKNPFNVTLHIKFFQCIFK